jgi:hypothetical protein
MPRVVFASSCRSVPSHVPGLVENQNWSLEVKEGSPTLGVGVLKITEWSTQTGMSSLISGHELC